MTYYYLYQIEHKSTGKIYVGVHRTTDIEDGYMGSGSLITRAIRKHGLHDFEKKILKFFDSAEEMLLAEKEIVNETFVKNENTYNLTLGGLGGWYHVNSEENISKYVNIRKKIRENRTPEKIKEEKEKRSAATSGEKNPMYGQKRNGDLNPMWGKKHGDKTKEMMQKKAIGKIVVKDTNGKTYKVGIDDPKYISGELKAFNSGMVLVKDDLGNTYRLPTDDPRIISGELVQINLGRTHSEQTKSELRELVSGTKWYNDGITSIRRKEHPGNGWKEGRLRFKKCN